MSDLLIRGLSPKARRKIQRLAVSENLSVNQEVIRLLSGALEQADRNRDIQERRAEAIRRIHALRKSHYQKYDMRDDSTKIIREMRDTRNQG